MAAAYVSNLVINAGASFNQTFNLSNTTDGSYLDLSLYSISAQMRKHAVSSVKTEFATNGLDPSIRSADFAYNISFILSDISAAEASVAIKSTISSIRLNYSKYIPIFITRPS